MNAAFRRRDVLLFTDWTLLRLFPPLRLRSAEIGRQAEVPITGSNDRGVRFGALNVNSACRTPYQANEAGSHAVCEFVKHLRSVYRRAGMIWLLAERASGHTAKVTQALAIRPGIRFIWLPKQCSEAQRHGSVVARAQASRRRQSASPLGEKLAATCGALGEVSDTYPGAHQSRNGFGALLVA